MKKEICRNCVQRYLAPAIAKYPSCESIGWTQYDEDLWDSQRKVLCIKNSKVVYVDEPPPVFCLYVLEHTV